ncbi:MAG TPA: polysaccharide pyruvyl transferase family protein [Fulvivirga sp.]|nr:polysaccharide pyruvyl transferase family protein [Fulvivirga sp.]
MKILLKGYYGFGNFGDDILLIVSYGLIKELLPNSEVFIFSNYGLNLSNHVNEDYYNNYIFKLIGENAKIIDWTFQGHFDIVLNGGGGVFFDKNKGSIGREILNNAIKFIGCQNSRKVEKILRKLFFKTENISFKRRIGVGLGIGEFAFGSPLFAQKMADMGSFDFLWVRDNYSYRKLDQYKFKNRVIKSSDLAFLSDYWNKKPQKTLDQAKKLNTIGIFLMDNEFSQSSLFNEILNLTLKLEQNEYQVHLFSLDENYDINLKAFFGDRLLIWKPNCINLADYLLKIAQCQIVISSRAHGAIIGGILGAIPICLESSIKLREVAEMFPESGRICSMDISAEDLSKIIFSIKSEYKNYTSRLSRDLDLNRTAILEGVTALKESLNES